MGVLKVGVGNAGALLEPPLGLVQPPYEFNSAVGMLLKSKDAKGLSKLRSLFRVEVGLGGSEPVLRATLVGRLVALRPVALSPTGRSFRC